MRYTISLLCSSLAAALPAFAEVPRVVTDIPPVQSLAAMVMGNLGQPAVLLDRGANAHDFQLRPSQAAALAEAELVIWVGPEMTPWLDRTLDGLSGDGARLALLTVEGTATRSFAEADAHDHAGENHGHDHGEAGHDEAKEKEAGHDHEAGHEAGHDHDHDHAHDGTDPHAWLDPGNAALWLTAIAAELSRLDPANAGVYSANSVTAAEGIAALDAGIAAQLQPVAGTPFVVFHDAYGYLADHYGLTVAGAVALGDAASPGAAHLKELQGQLAAGQALCIFPEANHDPKLVAVMAEGTGVKLGGALDPEGSQLDPGPALYAALMDELAETLVACLGGS